MENHPHIQALQGLYNAETQPFRKVHRLIDLFETIIKTHTAVIMAEYFRHNRLSDTAKGMLAQGLRTPSLGTWQLFSRVLFEELVGEQYAWSFPDFSAEFAQLDKALNADKTNVIAFRNTYAHGATPTDEQCAGDILKFEPFLQQLLQCGWLRNTRLESRENKVWMLSDAEVLCLHPILVCREEGKAQPYAFFNDLKNDKVGLLNYPLSKHYRDKDFFREFHECLPLHEWKKSGNQEFFQRIEELTETFKGRLPEREKLMQFVQERQKGYLSIQGNPGIGKSALIAQFFKDLRAREEMGAIRVVEYFIRRGTAQAQPEFLFNYLIRRTDELFAAGREIRAEGKTIWDLQQQLFAKWRLWGGQCGGSRLLFLIDGLDEGTENKLVSYMPRENFEGVLIIYGSRPGGHKTLDELWTQLPVEQHVRLELSGLGTEDIRALIYEVANKYELERESAWINAVQQRSQGNPLYLRLLCDALEHGSIALNDIHALPSKIDDYYKAILDRYAADTTDGDQLLAGLFTFAAARDYLTMAHLGLINKLGDAAVHRIGSTLKEVLYENPLTEEVLDYQLFHESFRDYLLREKQKQVSEAAERIIDCCSGWKELEGSWEQRYALEHYAAHLASSRKAGRTGLLFDLIYDLDYQTTQKKVLRGFDAGNALFRTALLSASEQNRFDEMLESALCLVDLKYEEANDAPQIVEMVANGEIEMALKRIEQFGSGDKEEIKRKFILYMLCLMELTLLESKNKPFCKATIEKLLNHFDEQIPTDTSIINWHEFFSSYLMFLMACEWAELGLDYSIFCKRTIYWDNDWIIEKGPFSDEQFDVLMESARSISDVYRRRSSVLKNISAELAKQGKNEQALECAKGIGDEWNKSSALREISSELAKQGKANEAIECARFIFYVSIKSSALSKISSQLAKQGDAEEAASAMQEAIECAVSSGSDRVKSNNLADISTELAKQGKIKEAASLMEDAFEYARCISNDSEKCIALSDISKELAKQGKIEEADSVMQELLSCARFISDEKEKSGTLKFISAEMAKQGRTEDAAFIMQEALECALGIRDEEKKSSALKDIFTELAKQGKAEASVLAMEEAFKSAQTIGSYYLKSCALREISCELAKQEKSEEALVCARGISNEEQKSSALKDISTELAKREKIEEAATVMQEAIKKTRGINSDSLKSLALREIASELAKQGKTEEALECAGGISSDISKCSALMDISCQLANMGKIEEADSTMQEALECARSLSSDRYKSRALVEISTESAKQEKTENAVSAMQEALECARDIIDEDIKSSVLRKISYELAKQGNIEEALKCSRGISSDYFMTSALRDISTELANLGKTEKAATQLKEALEYARVISSDYWRSIALKEISTELAKQVNTEEAALVMQESFECARDISSDRLKSLAIENISIELAKQGKAEIALECVQDISDESAKSRALKGISTKLAKQGNWALAESIGLQIPQIAERHECWKNLAEYSSKEDGWQKALQFNQLKSDESRLFYLKGWAKYVNLKECDSVCVKEALSQLTQDSESIEALLQKHALYEVFFGNAGREKINRLNRTLNIQWALDIKAQFKGNQETERLSTNLADWLADIADEDDREEIELLAKKVAKGKMTEKEFAERLSSMKITGRE